MDFSLCADLPLLKKQTNKNLSPQTLFMSKVPKSVVVTVLVPG